MVNVGLFAPVVFVVMTLDEEANIFDCIDGLVRLGCRVVVVDSMSKDRTRELAASAGAEVLDFRWDGCVPRKKQWSLVNVPRKGEWVFFVDADERVSASLFSEVITLIATRSYSGVLIPVEYHFDGGALRHGHRVRKLACVDPDSAQFPDVGDIDAPGIGEVEGHYQPEVLGGVAQARQLLVHNDQDTISSWLARHNRYSDWESWVQVHRSSRLTVRTLKTRQGRLFDRVPFKSLAFFLYSYVIRLGFLDGRRGFNYAIGLAFYRWQIGVKRRELLRMMSTD